MEQVHTNHNDGTPPDSAPTNMVPDIIKAKEARNAKLFKRGMIWLGIGVFFMGLSFAINIMFITTDMPVIPMMMIMTSIGGACIVKGLVDILGF